MGIHNDQALLGLAEDLRQPHHGKVSCPDHILEGKSRPHRRQLIRISHQNQPFVSGDRPQKAVEQLHIHHGHLIYNHRIRLQGIVLVPDKAHFPGFRVDSRFQKAMNGAGILPGHLRQPLGSTACGGSQHAPQLHLSQQGQNTI